MRNSEIVNLDFSGLYSLSKVSMIPGQMAIFNTVAELDIDKHPHRIQGAALTLINSGSCTVEINLNKYTLTRGCMVIITPSQIVQMKDASADFIPVCLAVSEQLIDELSYKVENISRFFLKVREIPFWRLESEDYNTLMDSITFFRNKLEAVKGVYHKNILEHLLISVFYECYGIIEKQKCEQGYSRKKELFDRFIKLLSEHHRLEHDVQFYADSLHVTAKYLSAVIDSMSGKGAKKWIDDYIILEAKVMLKSTTKSVQEIAYALGFSDMSFFGKYFKRMTGFSPLKYRSEG